MMSASERTRHGAHRSVEGINTFRDREEAGVLLAERLQAYHADPSTIVVALPRGGLIVGHTISQALRVPLEVFLSRKLGAPDNPEYAIGAVTETGSIYYNPEALRMMGGFSTAGRYFNEIIQTQRDEIRRRQELYRNGRLLPDLKNRTVLLVDDGVATGATFLAAVDALRNLQVRRLIAAIPVGPEEALRKIAASVDSLVVLSVPEQFTAVGNHYVSFPQISDEEVLRCLAQARSAGTKGNLRPEFENGH